MQVLSELQDSGSDNGLAIVATERCLQPHLPPPAALAQRCRTLRRGDSIDLEELAGWLAQLGYEKVSTIDQEGTWSRRGDIVDIFPVSSELPVRLELFGDELDKLREFDPASQRSLDPVEKLRLTPTGFSPLIAEQLRESMPDGLDKLMRIEHPTGSFDVQLSMAESQDGIVITGAGLLRTTRLISRGEVFIPQSIWQKEKR